MTKIKKTPKLEKVSSRIRLEPHKISLTPTSNRSPAQTPSKSPDRVPVESEANTGNEGDAPVSHSQEDQEKSTAEEVTDKDNDTEDSKVESECEDDKVISDGEQDKEGRSAKQHTRQKSFDEVGISKFSF